MFILNEMTKKYGVVTAVSNLTCKIPTNEFVFILGPSGSGKSTLLRLLSFVESPDEGDLSLELDNQLFNVHSERRPWPLITCVFQKQFLWPHLTLRENILLPMRSLGIADVGERLNSVVDLFEMSEFIDRYPNEVSGGQAQRAALARALVLKPRLILIDEAHGAMDLEQQGIVNNHLARLRAEGVGLIVVTHDLEFARHYADRVIIVEKGKITDFGTRDILYASTTRFLQNVLEGHKM